MKYIKTPLLYENDSHSIERPIKNRETMIDNFIELVVFTPRGSFLADPDFGFEYWNNEYSNIHYKEFNNEQNNFFINGLYNETTRIECEESIKRSIETYEPQLKQVEVSIELESNKLLNSIKNITSKYKVSVKVSGMLDEGLSILVPYKKEISFYMEPTVKQVII